MKNAYDEKRKKLILDDIKRKFPEITNARVDIMANGELKVFGLTEVQLLQLENIHKL